MYRNILLIIISTMLTTSLLSQSGIISEQLKSNIQSHIDADNIKGIVIGTTEGGLTNYYSKGVRSTMGDEPVDENTIFEIGSITKTFTGLLLADMHLEGKLKLDDSIQKYLPEGIKAPTRDDNFITLSHLSNHTSGLPRMPTNFSPADNSNPYVDYSAKNMYEFLNGYKLSRDIGATYEYSNFATGLLGHILSTVSNTTYEDLMVTTIADELGMEHTGITQIKGDLAKGHMGGNEVPNWDFDSLEGAGGIRSNPSDMIRYLKANMGLSKSKLYPAMQLAQKNSGAAKSNPIVGLGWHTMIYDNKEIIWHNGGTGGYTSFMGWIKGTDKGVVVLNNSTENVDGIGLNVLIPSYPLKAVRKSIDLDDDILEQYVGRYELAPSFILTVSKEDSQLIAQATGQGGLPIYPESEAKFFYKLVDAQLVFQRTESGEVESVTLYQGGQELVGKRLD